MYKIACLFLLIFTASCSAQTSVGVKGTLMCGKQIYNNAAVKLSYKHGTEGFKTLSETRQSPNGTFSITFESKDSKALKEIVLKIHHSCAATPSCERSANIKVPIKYITATSKIQEWFNIYTLNLEGMFYSEIMACY